MGAMRARGVQPHRAGGGRRLPSSAPGLWLAGLSDVARTAGRSCFCKGGYATGWGGAGGGSRLFQQTLDRSHTHCV